MLHASAKVVPPLREVKDMDFAFFRCQEFDQPITNWDVSKVNSFYSLFAGCTKFNQQLTWNLTSAEDMDDMFWECKHLNKPIQFSNTSKVRSLQGVFRFCEEFNQKCTGEWDVSAVKNTRLMFHGCTALSQEISDVFSFEDSAVELALEDGDARNGKMENVASMFRGCDRMKKKGAWLKGLAPVLFGEDKWRTIYVPERSPEEALRRLAAVCGVRLE